ncbi:MAG TPA: tetratricopeptide repeat protein [Panacibacter sp.]|nr:tetratricopeptide repeat protein [Panacibacter sp.]
MKRNRYIHFKLALSLLLFSHFAFAQSPANSLLEARLNSAATQAQKLPILLALCKSYLLTDLSKANDYGKEALATAEQLKDDRSKIEILKNLINCGLPLNEYDACIGWMQEGLKMSKALADQKSECDFLFLAGMVYHKRDEDSLTLQSFEKALTLSQQIKYPEGEGNALKGLGHFYEKAGEKERSRKYFNEALPIAQKTGYAELQITTLIGLGSSYLIEGDHNKALEYYIQAATKATDAGNLNKLTEAYGNMSIVYKDIGEKEKAIEQNLKVLELCKTTKNKTIEGLQYDNMANCYNELGKYNEAMKYAQKSLATRQQINDPKLICYSYITIAQVYKSKEDLPSALAYYNKGLAIGEKIGHKVLVGRTNIEIGDVLLRMNRPQEAKPHLLLAIKKLDSTGSLKPQVTAYELLAEACFRSNEPAKAYRYLQKHIAIKDSLTDDERNRELSRMEVQFETKEKEGQITSLQKQSGLQTALLQKNTQLNTWYVIGLILLCLLAFLFYNRSRLKQKNNQLLLAKNKEIEEKSILIEKSLAEKETLLREIHHRVKNNLQIISSLLNIQSAHITDENVLSSIHEGQSRVQAMSLIHQNLYQSEHLNKVDIASYLQQLSDYLSDMFSGQNKLVNVTVSAANINFDLDTAIPLGLIVNELVSNAYKYAFDKNTAGNISITIKFISNTDYELQVRDNGKGLSNGFNPENTNSLGLKLVKILSRQLRGSFSMQSQEGAVAIVKFKDVRAADAAA